MIRLIVVFIGILLICMWTLTPLTRRTKISITVASLIAAVALIIWETYDNKPRQGLVTAKQLSICNLAVAHSYRTDYSVDLCVKNDSAATVKRLHFSLQAQECEDDSDCSTIATVSRDIPVNIDPDSQVELSQTLRFDSLQPEQLETLSWSLEWLEIKAVP